ncbi:MAG: fucose isomerase, partial [Oscillospiraceae bacterium]|nr:fucose isomerase [Oscillospiraceae bacterium]
MQNIPNIKLGLISVSRDCFVVSLSERRRAAVAEAYKNAGGELFECKTTVENETDMLKALSEVKAAGCNALTVFLGNFGPETPETLLAKYFDGPVMYAAAAEETGKDLINGRGDAYCGMLNCSYNLGLRKLKAVVPHYPVGTADEVAAMMTEFVTVACALVGLKNLKIISFGPRPQDFMACNAPIKALFDLGVEIEENSELDLLTAFNQHKDDTRIPTVAADMAKELGSQNGILTRLAQYELTLLDWMEAHKGARQFVAFANKCWPAFQTEFGFVPCYINSRLAALGIPVACETDIYGALSEYIGTCITGESVTLLDINNSVPQDLFDEDIKSKFDYTLKDTFMGFHCGNTPVCRLKTPALKHQLIMKRLLEPNGDPDITRGTLEGDLIPGKITLFRLQSGANTTLKAYVAQGEILPVSTRSFGGIGIFAVPEMARFYRYVLIEDEYP